MFLLNYSLCAQARRNIAAFNAHALGNDAQLHESSEHFATDTESQRGFKESGACKRGRDPTRCTAEIEKKQDGSGDAEERSDSLGKTLRRARDDAVLSGQTGGNDLCGQSRKRAESRAREDAGDKAVCKRYENPGPSGDGIARGHENSPRCNDASGRVIHLRWKVEQFGHLLILDRASLRFHPGLAFGWNESGGHHIG